MWPDDDELPVEVWAAFGANPDGDQGDWTWTDLTGRLLANPIPLRKGSASGDGTVSPSSATIHLLNDDGALTPLRSQSEYYPHVVLGTPIWLTLRRLDDAFGRAVSNGWGVADSGQAWTTAGGTSSNYSVSAGQARIANPTVNALRQVTAPVYLLDTHHLIDTATSAVATGAAAVTGVMARYNGSDYYWCRTEFNSGSTTVMAKISRVVGGVHTDLGDVIVPGLSYAAGVPLRTRVAVIGNRIWMNVWTAAGSEPAGWQLDVTDPDPLTEPGGVGVQTWLVPGNTNVGGLTIAFDNYRVSANLFNGFADQWQPQFIPSTDGMASIVRLTASGILRRLGQGSTPRSALTRYLANSGPVFYHPLEDGADSSVAASGIPGGAAMTVRNGVMDFTGDAPPGAAGSAHPTPNASNALVGLVSGAGSTGFQIGVWTKGELINDDNSDPAASAYYIPWEVRTSTGQIFRLVMQWDETVAIGVGHYSSESQTTATQFLELEHRTAGITGEWIHCQFMARQSGANIDVFLWVDGVLVDSATWNGVTVGAPVRVNAIGGFAGTIGDVSLNMRNIWLSQLVLHDFASSQVTQYNQGLGFPGETASDRIERVCAERGIPVYIRAGDSEPLGVQPTGSDLDVLRDAEQADMGILYEHGWGLAYRPRSARYNQAPALTVDLETYMHSQEIRPESVVAPTYDDQGTRNDVTVSREGGSSARVIDHDHAERHGTYDDSVTLSLATDAQTAHHAGWRVHLGTWEEMRYPGIPVDLAGQPELIDEWLSLQPGDRVVQTNVPAPHPPEDVDQIAGGISQTLNRAGAWSGSIVGTPARPWDVGVVEDSTYGRADTDGSRWVGSVAAGTDTSALVLVTAGPPWVTTASHASQFPFNVRSGGSVLEVTGIAAAVSDSFTRSASNGWGTATTGQAWSVNSGAASEYSVTSNAGRMTLASANDLHVISVDAGSTDADPRFEFVLPVVPTGAPFTIRSIARMTTVADYYYSELTIGLSGVVTLRLHKRVSNTATQLGSAVTLGPVHAAGDRWVLQCSAIGSTIRARAWKDGQPAEKGWQITETDTALTTGTRVGVAARRETSNSNGSQIVTFDNFAAPGLQTFTLTAAPVNGVERTIPAGTALSLATPWRLAL